ncbi:DUF4129 domain-containing transglutaminase family protein [Kroppenstedtia eburnea]|uniref:DUF4129 domain-containing transglutaminase family protein n=1 Tax=Kroppenstedtia eburnea TaxID=714067 RepID=UPI00362CB583
MAKARPDSRSPLSPAARVGGFLFAFLIGWECLLPLVQVLESGRVGGFLAAFLFFLVITFVGGNRWITVPLRLLLLPVFLHPLLFHQMPWEDPAWIQLAVSHLITDLEHLFTGEVVPAGVLQTLGFLLMLWLIASGYRRFQERGGGVLVLFLAAVIHLSILDSFTSFDGGWAIVRVLVYGFIALSASRLVGLRSKTAGDPPKPGGWVPLTLSLLLLALGVGWVAPKPEAGWPNPVEWIASQDDRAQGRKIAKIGYGNHDQQLGGPFKQNSSPILFATVDVPYYWRGETRDFYTGKGWQSTLKKTPVDPVKPDRGESELQSGFEGIAVKKNDSIVMVERKYPVLFTPGWLRWVEGINADNRWEQIPEMGGLTTPDDEWPARYRLRTEIPVIDEDQLRQTGTEYHDLGEAGNVYLQLPESLPDRVRQKAEELTRGEDNPYDRAAAVENWLRSGGGFRYETEDIPVPGQREDFVDQFLFDSQRGYCDHFSTSMVVMLRSVGIPARWMKGFAPGEGEMVEVDDPKQKGKTVTEHRITVRNSDAHSWVEVYFAGVGWIPFEPTPGFANPTPVMEDERGADAGASEGEEQGTATNREQRLNRMERELARTGGETEGGSPQGSWDWKMGLAWIGGSLVVAFFLLRMLRRRIAWMVLDRRNRKNRDLVDAFHGFLRWLAWSRGPRKPHETVREYLFQRDPFSQASPELRRLSQAYEAVRYGGVRGGKAGLDRIRELWQRVLKQFRP